MEIKKLKIKQLCPHKLARISLDIRSSRSKMTRKQQKSPTKSERKTKIQ